jgi:predicted nucleic acid-binding protein
MGERYLLDTNILIYLQKGISDTQAITFLSQAIAANPKISVITEIEVLGFKFDSVTDLQKMEDLIADTVVLPLDKAVALKTISIRRMHKIKLPDAIIAATALVHGLALITRNTSDFSSIDNLSVINPFAL